MVYFLMEDTSLYRTSVPDHLVSFTPYPPSELTVVLPLGALAITAGRSAAVAGVV